MTKKSAVRNMTEGAPLPMMLQFLLPLLLGNLVQQTYSMVDAIIVGRMLGPDALAAVGTSTSYQLLVLGLCTGSCSGFAIPIAQSFGGRDYSAMRSYIWHSILCSVMVAVVMTSLSVGLGHPVLHLLKTPAGIYQDAYKYILILFLGIPFTILYNLLASILRAVGNSKMPFLFLMFSSVLNILLDALCVGALHWGCAGAAAATIASQAISGILCLIYVITKVSIIHPQAEDRRWDKGAALLLLKMGLPMGFQFSITAIGSMLMQTANNNLGTVYVSAFSAGMRIKQFAKCPYDALCVAIATFVGQNFGAKKMDRVRQGIRQGLTLAIGYGILAGIIMAVFGRDLCALFIGYGAPEVLDAGAKYLFFLSLLFFVIPCTDVHRSSLQSLGYSGRAMVGGVLEMLARSFVSVFLVPVFGFTAICLADQAAWICAATYMILMFRHVLRKLENRTY